MKGTAFFKMTGSGNDFVMLDGRADPAERWTGPWCPRCATAATASAPTGWSC